MNINDVLNLIEDIRKKKQPINVTKQIIKSNDKKQINVEQALKKIQERADSGLNAVETCRKQIATQWGEKGSEYFDKVLQAFALSDDPSINLAAPRYHVEQGFETLYNHSLYERILPLCQLAYLHEKNGDPEEHAFKLSILCSHLSHKNALAKISIYLRQFAKANPKINQALHDACLFDLPLPFDGFDVKRWCIYALNTNNKQLLLLDPIFKKIMPNAEQIERIEQREPVAQLIDKKEEINHLEKKIQEQTKAIKKITAHLARANGQELLVLKNLSTDKADGLIKLANLYQGQKFDGKNLMMLQAFYELYCSEHSGPAYTILTQYGITEKSKDVFLKLKRQNDDTAIPNIVISGDELGYPEYTIKKLDIESDKGAALAACLGKITNCCQYLGGAGESCTINGISSPNSGFYVLCKQSGSDSDEKIMAQTWVWRSKDNALCFDSIEKSKGMDESITVAMYRYLAFMLCTRTDLLGCPVNQVNVGGESGISRKAGMTHYPAPTQLFRDYRGYSDSASQLKVADASMPYLLFSEAQGQFKLIIEQNTREFFIELFKQSMPLNQNTAMKQAIAFSLNLLEKNQSLLDCLKQAGEQRIDELKTLIEVSQQFREGLEKNSVHLELIDQGAYCYAMNSKGISALHIAVLNKDTTTITRLIEKNINLNIQDKYLNTPLILAVKNNDLAMAKYLVEQGADLENCDESRKTALFWAAEQGHNKIFDYLYERKAEVNIADYPNCNSVLLKAIKSKNTHIITTLLHHPGINLTAPNGSGFTPIQEAIFYAPEFIMLILEKIPENKRLASVQAADIFGKTALYCAAPNHESLQAILNVYPLDQRLEAIKRADRSGTTVLHHGVSNPESVKTILNLYPEEQRLEAVEQADKRGKTVLHCAAHVPKSLQALLKVFPKCNRLDAVQRADDSGSTVLHHGASNPESIKTILNLYPEEQRLKAVDQADKSGRTVVHYAQDEFESLKAILGLIPENQRIDFLKKKFSYITICEALHDEDILINGSFAPDYIKISKILSKNSGASSSFFSNTTPQNLQQKFLEAQTFESAKEVIIDFLIQNPQHIFSQTLLTLLTPEEKNLDALYLRWNIEPDKGQALSHII